MKQKFILTACLAILFAFSIEEIQAQTEQPSKTVIVKTIKVDEKGNETIDIEKYEGEAADRFIDEDKRIKEEIMIDVEVELDEEGNDKTVVKERRQYRMKVKDGNGEEKLIEWTGEGEMPAEMKKYMEDNDVDFKKKEKRVIKKKMKKKEDAEDYEMIFMDKDGNKQVLKWDGEGEMPAEMKKSLEENDIDIVKILGDLDVDVKKGDRQDVYKMKFIDEDGKETLLEWNGEGEMPEEMSKHMKDHNIWINDTDDGHTVVRIEDHVVEDKNQNKAQLGVMIEDHTAGVRITDFVEGSNAERAGLMKDDVISLLNGKQITDIESLVNGLSSFKAGDTVEISYIRGDVEKTIKVLLSPRSPSKEKRYKWKSVEKDN